MTHFMFSGIFWGGILIIIGLITILNTFLPFSIPIMRLLFAFLLIYWGMTMLTGNRCSYKKNKYSSFCTEDTIIIENDMSQEHREYNTAFGKRIIDLTNIDLSSQNKSLDIDTVFGETIIYIKAETPISIQARASFGSVTFPDGTQTGFGKQTYTTPSYTNSAYHIDLKANAVFGSIRIIQKNNI